ncbi:GNAT family N-acetyltransferase [Couchioplanes caeruleus]|uniref:GNAT family N-acetyltransferase n=1 Tax=Couchioplanes caeruleus TaxID=56438 RepID=UPI0020BFBC26|nr:GNAT family N-acetyltransferase [Couchioplanes caeruleus]
MLTVRPATASDVDTLRRLTAAAFEKYVPRLGRDPKPMHNDYREAVSAGRVWVAVAAGEIVGLALLVPHEDHLLLDTVAVSPDAQGRGVGGRLLELADEQARQAGRPEVRLCTNEVMTENLAYYPRRGYVETHRVEQNGLRRVYFRKPVAPPR